jgi:hypothetical protein
MAATGSDHPEAFPASARELSGKDHSRNISMFVPHGNRPRRIAGVIGQRASMRSQDTL